MSHVCTRSPLAAGLLGAALFLGTPALAKPHTGAHPIKGMPLVLPGPSLSSLRKLNPKVSFNVLCLSQVPIMSTGAVTQTAVVDVVPPNGASNPGSIGLFMFPPDVLLTQQLNQGANVSPVAFFPMPPGTSGVPTQVAQVNITETTQKPTSLQDLALVCPVSSLPLLPLLNPGMSFSVLRVSQVAGSFGPTTQTALVGIQQQGGVDPAQPFPLFVPVSDLPALGQLNIGSTIQVVNVFQAPLGSTGQVIPVAFVKITPNSQALDRENQNDRPDDDKDGHDHGKHHGGDHGHGHHGDDDDD